MTNERAEIISRIAELIEQETDIHVEVTDESQSLKDSFGLDSVDLVSVIMRVESEYCIRMNQTDLEGVANIGQFVDLIQAKRATAALKAAA